MTSFEAAADRSNQNSFGFAPNPARESLSHAERGEASKRVITGFGFWIFLLSDIVMFSAFFATYAVLFSETAGGPAARDIFKISSAAWETAFLLVSSFFCGVASIGSRAHRGSLFYVGMAATFIFGGAFLAVEITEFADLISKGYGPMRSAFLSAFFALVGCHGLHVSVGLLWLLTMVAQVFAKGYRADILRRLLCFSLFWHALDIIWVGIFTVVYLISTGR